MQITDRFIARFAITSIPEPVEIPLSGFESRGQWVASTDIPAEDERASQLDIIYRDDNPPDTDAWDIEPEKFKTFVVPRRDGNDIDSCGYLFDGILAPADARGWYRAKWGYAEPEPVEPAAEEPSEQD